MTETKTAEKRAMELFHMNFGDMPPLALRYAKHLCSQVGMCGETFLTAYAAYAQIVEGLPVTDSLYVASLEARNWFAANRRATT